jgi:hypothetical protein
MEGAVVPVHGVACSVVAAFTARLFVGREHVEAYGSGSFPFGALLWGRAALPVSRAERWSVWAKKNGWRNVRLI